MPLRTVPLLIAVVAAIVPTALSGQNSDAELVARARAIHERVITLDTHDDINPANFTPDCNYTQRLTTQVNLPKMKEGGLDVAFFIVYVGQGPLTPEGLRETRYRQAIAKFDAIHRLTERSRRRDRAGADAGGRARIAASGQEGRGDRHRERLPDRHRHRERERVLRSRRALHVAGAQRPQPALRFQHRRGDRRCAERRLSRSAGR